MSPRLSDRELVELSRMFDVSRGAFDPVSRDVDVRRPGKTAQDRMKVADRPRVKAAQSRRRRMQFAAELAGIDDTGEVAA